MQFPSVMALRQAANQGLKIISDREIENQIKYSNSKFMPSNSGFVLLWHVFLDTICRLGS